MVSVILPTANERDNAFLKTTLENLARIEGIEVICIDKSAATSRAERLNIGFDRSRGSMILFHHPRSVLDVKGIEYLVQHCDDKIWGAFTHQFDLAHPLLKFTSWYSNKIRGQGRSIFYLDHCIFFHRSLRNEALPPIEIFEDTVLSEQLRKQLPPILLPMKSTTSAIRFLKNGFFKQSLMNQLLKIAYTFKFSDRIMNKIYEKNLNLNNQTTKWP